MVRGKSLARSGFTVAFAGALVFAYACGDDVEPARGTAGTTGGAVGGTAGAFAGSAGAQSAGAGAGGAVAGMSGSGGAGMAGFSGGSGVAGLGGMAGAAGGGGVAGGGMAGLGGESGESGDGGDAGDSGAGGDAGDSGAGGEAGDGPMGGTGGAGMGGAGMAGMAGGGTAGTGGTPGVPTLYFTEYYEGSGGGAVTAFEVYNGGTASVDLTSCQISIYYDGNTTPVSSALTGMLAAGETFVFCNGGLGTGVCDQVQSGIADISGNDAVALVCATNSGAVVLDVIGQIGNSPAGGEWGNATVGTANQTLRRACAVTTGDTNGSDAFDPATEWEQFAANTTNGLGVRLCPCPSGDDTCP